MEGGGDKKFKTTGYSPTKQKMFIAYNGVDFLPHNLKGLNSTGSPEYGLPAANNINKQVMDTKYTPTSPKSDAEKPGAPLSDKMTRTQENTYGMSGKNENDPKLGSDLKERTKTVSAKKSAGNMKDTKNASASSKNIPCDIKKAENTGSKSKTPGSSKADLSSPEQRERRSKDMATESYIDQYVTEADNMDEHATHRGESLSIPSRSGVGDPSKGTEYKGVNAGRMYEGVKDAAKTAAEGNLRSEKAWAKLPKSEYISLVKYMKSMGALPEANTGDGYKQLKAKIKTMSPGEIKTAMNDLKESAKAKKIDLTEWADAYNNYSNDQNAKAADTESEKYLADVSYKEGADNRTKEQKERMRRAVSDDIQKKAIINAKYKWKDGPDFQKYMVNNVYNLSPKQAIGDEPRPVKEKFDPSTITWNEPDRTNAEKYAKYTPSIMDWVANPKAYPDPVSTLPGNIPMAEKEDIKHMARNMRLYHNLSDRYFAYTDLARLYKDPSKPENEQSLKYYEAKKAVNAFNKIYSKFTKEVPDLVHNKGLSTMKVPDDVYSGFLADTKQINRTYPPSMLKPLGKNHPIFFGRTPKTESDIPGDTSPEKNSGSVENATNPVSKSFRECVNEINDAKYGIPTGNALLGLINGGIPVQNMYKYVDIGTEQNAIPKNGCIPAGKTSSQGIFKRTFRI